MGGASIAPDNDVFVHLAKEYSHNHASMYQGNLCIDSRPFLEGITNGFQWYRLEGERVWLSLAYRETGNWKRSSGSVK